MLPYPHARNDCEFCRERDADFELLGEHAGPAGKRPRRYCRRCIGEVMVSISSFWRPQDVSPGEPVTLTYMLLPPGERSW